MLPFQVNFNRKNPKTQLKNIIDSYRRRSFPDSTTCELVECNNACSTDKEDSELNVRRCQKMVHFLKRTCVMMIGRAESN